MSVTIALLLVCLVLSVIVIVLVTRTTAEFGRLDRLIRDEFSRSREENYKTSRGAREELEGKLDRIRTIMESNQEKTRTTMEGHLEKIRITMEGSLEKTRATMENNMERTRQTLENKLKSLQEDNAKKLEEMRVTVDEKLQSTVEKRFSDSFKLISDRLEQVHKGLGEMQTLASGVGDLKKVLTNVKTRGNLGEIQLGAILEEIFAADHYEYNAIVKPGSQERVEYVIKLPGKNEDNQSLLLPIDSKFPNEDYQRLLEAYDNMANLDPRQVDAIGKQFEAAVKKSARDIREKYINPPTTTDFAILFVPTEGLYAEILRRAGLFETLEETLKSQWSVLRISSPFSTACRWDFVPWPSKNVPAKFGRYWEPSRRSLEISVLYWTGPKRNYRRQPIPSTRQASEQGPSSGSLEKCRNCHKRMLPHC